MTSLVDQSCICSKEIRSFIKPPLDRNPSCSTIKSELDEDMHRSISSLGDSSSHHNQLILRGFITLDQSELLSNGNTLEAENDDSSLIYSDLLSRDGSENTDIDEDDSFHEASEDADADAEYLFEARRESLNMKDSYEQCCICVDALAYQP